MSRVVALFLGVFFCSALASSAGDAGEEDLKRLQGKWKFVERIIDGKKGDLDFKGTWMISGNEIIYGPGAKVRAVFKLDATTKPKTFDFDHVAKDGKVVE